MQYLWSFYLNTVFFLGRKDTFCLLLVFFLSLFGATICPASVNESQSVQNCKAYGPSLAHCLFCCLGFFLSKLSLDYSHVHLFTYVCGCFFTPPAELRRLATEAIRLSMPEILLPGFLYTEFALPCFTPFLVILSFCLMLRIYGSFDSELIR